MSERFLVTAAEVVTVRQKYDKVQKLYKTFKELQRTIDRSGPTESSALAKVLKDVQTQLVKLANEVKVGIEKIKKSDVNPPFREFANRVAARAKEHYNVKTTVKTAVGVEERDGGILIGYSAAVVLSSKDKAGTVMVSEFSELGNNEWISLWLKAQAGAADPSPSFKSPGSYFSGHNAKDDQLDVFVHQAAGMAGIPAKGQKAGSGTGVYSELLKVFPSAKKTTDGFEFWLSGQKELQHRKEPLNLPASVTRRLESEVSGLGKLSESLGCSTSGRLSFDEIDYYDGSDTEFIPVFTLRDNKFSLGDMDTNTIPKGWMMDWSFTVKVPANSKLTEKDFQRFKGLKESLPEA